MQIFLLLLLAIAPGIILIWFFYFQDALEREPKRVVLYAFLLGIGSIIPAILLEKILGAGQEIPTIGYIAYEAFIAVALVEEGIKYLFVRYWAMSRKEFNELYDGIVYATAISLGFATLENIMYVMDGGVGIGIVRAIFTVPMHALGSVMIGYYLAKKRYNFDNERFLLFKGLVAPITMHGMFNFFLTSQNIFLALLIIPLMIVYVVITYRIFGKIRHTQPRFAAQLHASQNPTGVASLEGAVSAMHIGTEIGEPRQGSRINSIFWSVLAIVIAGIVTSISLLFFLLFE